MLSSAYCLLLTFHGATYQQYDGDVLICFACYSSRLYLNVLQIQLLCRFPNKWPCPCRESWNDQLKDTKTTGRERFWKTRAGRCAIFSEIMFRFYVPPIRWTVRVNQKHPLCWPSTSTPFIKTTGYFSSQMHVPPPNFFKQKPNMRRCGRF